MVVVFWSLKKLTHLTAERGELIDVFARVFAIRNTKAKIKVESLEQIVPEIVTLDHSETVQWLVSD